MVKDGDTVSTGGFAEGCVGSGAVEQAHRSSSARASSMARVRFMGSGPF